jgi:protein-tyrosine phosphatase
VKRPDFFFSAGFFSAGFLASGFRSGLAGSAATSVVAELISKAAERFRIDERRIWRISSLVKEKRDEPPRAFYRRACDPLEQGTAGVLKDQSMLLGVCLLLLSIACGLLAVSRGGVHWLALWPAISFLVIAAAYLGGGPRLIGKRRSGRLHPIALLVHAPYLLLTWIVFHVVMGVRGSRDASEVANGLWIGRRPMLRDIPIGTTLLADMTCEYSRVRGMDEACEYTTLPTLDNSAPPLAQLLPFVRRIAAHKGIVYLHCAQGHGRSALAMACVLLARGEAADAEAVLAMIRKVRPRIRLTRGQMKRLREAAALLTPSPP